jgi:hypothetical protein
VEAKEFFRAMAKKYSGYLVEQEVPVVPASLESTPEESAPENSTQEDADVLVNVQIVETEDDDDDVGEHFESRGLFSEHIGCYGTPSSLPCTEKVVAALQRNDNLERVVDSQMTTLG